ncbi:uncharacterized protein LOC107047624, partial [Diachasma alloeum]|uniref:uncharacterized protein LOC107047624 n=1 Tax=Diachasma alloeum TaxID=454923 RepID=UPI0007384036
MSTHAVQPQNAPSNHSNHITTCHKSPPMPLRIKETLPQSAPPTSQSATISQAQVIPVTSVQPAFVRPFEDSFRGSTKVPIWGTRSHSVQSQIGHGDVLKSVVTTSSGVQSHQECVDSKTSVYSHQAPHQNYHPVVSQVGGLYKPQVFTPLQLPQVSKPVASSNGDVQKFSVNGGKMHSDNSEGNQRNNGAAVSPMENSLGHEKSVNANFYSNVEGNLMSKHVSKAFDSSKDLKSSASDGDASGKQINHRVVTAGEKFKVNSEVSGDVKAPVRVDNCEREETKAPDVIGAAVPLVPYQPFKFSISDISHKTSIDSQILQSIKSEEVLRTCQNVSNVLLQIPKYQEKLLNFSSNEFKSSFCYTDKCNNLTEITVKCEPPVLNVPDPRGFARGADGRGDFLADRGRDITSTLDLAEKKRKRKREKSCGNNRSSESEGEGDVKDSDLWITKGPPAKLTFSEKKLTFLAIFGLTTLSTRN